MGDSRHQGVDVAVEVLQALDVAVDPVLGQPLAALGQMLEELAEQLACALPSWSCGNRGPGRLPRAVSRAAACAAAAGTPNASTGSAGRADRPVRAPAAARHACGGRLSEAISAGTERKCRSLLRHCTSRSGSKRWFSIASTSSGSSPPTSAVVPKVPSFMWRPARPAICASSTAAQRAQRAAVEFAQGRRTPHGRRPC